MSYRAGQILGILAAVLCVCIPFWKKKSQMLVNTAAVNLMVAFNFILIGKIGSAFVMDLIATVQSLVSLAHVKRNTKVAVWEHVLFLVLYAGLGIAGVVLAPDFVPGFSAENLLEILPITAAVILVSAVFVRDEQKTRQLSLVNAVLWILYDAAVGTTAVFSQLFSAAAITIALIRNRKRKT